MDELSHLARSRTERGALVSARKLSGRMGAVNVVFFPLVPFVILAIAAWNGRLSSTTVAVAAVLLMFGNFCHVHRVFFRLLQRQADEIAALREGENAAR